MNGNTTSLERNAAAAHPFTSIEPLESRIAPSTFLVTNIKNAGAGSLRDAIDHANAAPGADDIAFTGKARGIILLKSALPVIDDDLTITGPGAGKLTIDGQGRRQIFAIDNNYSDDGTGTYVTTPTNVTISGLNLAHGRGTSGGAIEIDNPGGRVLLQFSKLTGNKAIGFENTDPYSYEDTSSARGGAVALLGGTLEIAGCTITKNVARAAAGGTASGGGVFGGEGTILEIRASNISGNTVVGGTGAGGARGENGEDSYAAYDVGEKGGTGGYGGVGEVGNIGGSGVGGGVAAFGSLTIQTSTISGNIALGGAGGRGGRGGTGGMGGQGGYGGTDYDGNKVPRGKGGNGGAGGDGGTGGSGGEGFGGGIQFAGASLTIVNSTISGNVASAGSAGAGGKPGFGGAPGKRGPAGPPPDPYGDDFGSSYGGGSDNRPGVAGAAGARGAAGEIGVGDGGGIHVSSSSAIDPGGEPIEQSVTLSQVTISKNLASSSGGGIHHSEAVSFLVKNSTVAGNKAGTGGGIFTDSIGADSPFRIISTIVAGNAAASSPDIAGSVDATSSLVQSIVGAEISGTGNVLSIAALLGKLKNNGGPTQTILPKSTSPAIGAGSNPDSLTTDQRGLARVLGTATDIGAVEAG